MNKKRTVSYIRINGESLRQMKCRVQRKMGIRSGSTTAYTLSLCVLLLLSTTSSVSNTNAFSRSAFVRSPRRTQSVGVQQCSSFGPQKNNKATSFQHSGSLLHASNSEPTASASAPAGGVGEDLPTPSLVETASGLSAAVTGNPPFMVTLDDGTQHSYTEAIQRTLGWVSAAIVFGGGLWAVTGSQAGQEFFAGYLVEQSLSVDNLFVFLLLFEYFKVPLQYQDRVLNWGIYGAMVMRAIMIGIGAAALQNFHAILLVFAAILVYSSVSFFVGGGHDTEEDPSQNSIVKFSRSVIQSTDHFDGDRFFTMVDGVRQATPLFICMIAVEISDVVFAVDSIPAVFGVTENPLIVFSSNIFAIMGLRSMFTILSKAATDLKYLEPAVALVLGFIGSKMIAEYFDYFIPTYVALTVVATLLGSGVGLSVLEKQKELEEEQA